MLDAEERVSGRVNYVLNFELPGMLTGKILRSPLPHARLVTVDGSRAERLAGASAVLTRNDFGSKTGFTGKYLQQTMAAQQGVGRTSSIADIIRRTYEVFAPEEAAKGPPAAADLLGQLFFLGESPAFERFVDRAYSRSVVFGYMDREDSALTRRVIGGLERYLAGHRSQTIRVSIAGGVGPTLLAL